MDYSDIFHDFSLTQKMSKLTNEKPFSKIATLNITTYLGEFFDKWLSVSDASGSAMFEISVARSMSQGSRSKGKHLIEIPSDKSLVGFRIGKNKVGLFTSL